MMAADLGIGLSAELSVVGRAEGMGIAEVGYVVMSMVYVSLGHVPEHRVDVLGVAASCDSIHYAALMLDMIS